MKRSELKKVLKPLIKECIKEVIFEEGVLSGLITEVAQGLGNTQSSAPLPVQSTQQPDQRPDGILEAKKQLNEIKSSLSSATGLQGIFEGTKPLANKTNSQSSQYGALRDKDPNDPGVNIDALIKMTGGWSHLK
jgi:hypothetical protein